MITWVLLSPHSLLELSHDQAGFAYLLSLSWLEREFFFYKIPVHSYQWQIISFRDFKCLLGRMWLNWTLPCDTRILQPSKFTFICFCQAAASRPFGSMYNFSSRSQKNHVFCTAVWIFLKVHKLKMFKNYWRSLIQIRQWCLILLCSHVPSANNAESYC